MLKYFGRKFFTIFGVIFFTFFTIASTSAQTKSNLDIFYMMVDSSGAEIMNSLPQNSKTIKLDLNLTNDYSVFGNRLIKYLTNRGITISQSSKDSTLTVLYVIDNTSVKYPEIFSDGFLGTYYTRRKLKLSGNFVLMDTKPTTKNFSFTYKDSVKTGTTTKIQNPAFPFTKGEIPPEPFFSNLLEPVIAIGSAAVAVILFFTVRSK